MNVCTIGPRKCSALLPALSAMDASSSDSSTLPRRSVPSGCNPQSNGSEGQRTRLTTQGAVSLTRTAHQPLPLVIASLYVFQASLKPDVSGWCVSTCSEPTFVLCRSSADVNSAAICT
jgi:hypothetical protein